MKIALLTHLSPTFPLLIADLIEGLNSTLGEKHELNKHYLSANANNKTVIEEVQKLALEGVDLVIAYTNVDNLIAIQELLGQFQKKAILIDSNAQYYNPTTNNENCYWLSMQTIESAEFLAKCLLSETEGSVAMLSGFINSGYQMSYFFSNTFVKENRDIVFQYAASANGLNNNDLDQIANRLILEKPSVVYINSFATEGKQFSSLINRKDIQKHLPNTKWAINNQLLNELEENSLSGNIFACTTWYKDAINNLEFSNQYFEKTKRKPSLFTCIGYEAGIIANQLENNSISNFDSPRGKIFCEKETHTFRSMQSFYEFDQSTKKMLLSKQVFVDNTNPENQDNIDFGGWTNTYLCY